MCKYIRLTLIILLLTIVSPIMGLFAERVGGTVKNVYKVEFNGEIEGSLKLHQLIGIELPKEEFIKGLEIRLKVPKSAMEFRESFLFRIFSNLNKDPDLETKSYYGSEAFSKAFPVGKTLYIAIPLDNDEPWNPSGVGLSSVKPPLSLKDFPLLLAIEPVMKGIPSSVAEAIFNFTIVPVLHDRGKLSIELRDTYDPTTFTMSIDGISQEYTGEPIPLKTGMHKLEIKSPVTLPFSTTFGIEKGETTKVDISLKPAGSFVSFEAPDEATIYFDGDKLHREQYEELETEPGEHIVLIQLGEYSLSKKIHLNQGENYKVSLFFDILVDED